MILDGKEYEFKMAIRDENGKYKKCSICSLLDKDGDKISCPASSDHKLYSEYLELMKKDKRSCNGGFYAIKNAKRLKLKL